MAYLITKLTLAKDPNAVQTKTGTPMATAFGFAKLKGNDTPDLGLGVVAFGSVAEALLNHQKGQSIQISGDLEMRVYQNREGQQVEQLQITLDMLASAKSTKPVRSPSRQANGNQSNRRMTPQPPTNQYQGDMGFQQRPNQSPPQMQAPIQPSQFDDDDINF